MSRHHKTIGVVLAEAAHGENGKRLTIFTKDFGKVTAFANGAKKAKSPLLAASQLFVFGNFELYYGKSSYTLTGAEVIESFYELRSDLRLMAYASYFSELSLVFLQDGLVSEDALKLLYVAFEEMVHPKISFELLRAIFELKLLALAGYAPELSVCIRCGESENLAYFNCWDGGCVCLNCANKSEEKLNLPLQKAMNYVLDMPMDKVFRFRLGEEYERQFTRLIRQYLEQYLDYPLKAEKFLKEMFY